MAKFRVYQPKPNVFCLQVETVNTNMTTTYMPAWSFWETLGEYPTKDEAVQEFRAIVGDAEGFRPAVVAEMEGPWKNG